MRSRFVLPVVRLDRGATTTLPCQIEQQMTEAIGQGALPAGARLPSSRLFSRLLGVSRNTVVAAYAALEDRGLVQSAAGSGVVVQGAKRPTTPGFTNLRRTVREAHYPARVQHFVDPDGTGLYLNQVG